MAEVSSLAVDALPSSLHPLSLGPTSVPLTRRWTHRAAALRARQYALLSALLAVWEFAPRLGLVNAVFLPPLSAVLEAGAVLIVNGQLFVHLATSFVRSLMGFSLAVAIAVPAGLLIGWSRPIADVVSPVVELLRNTAALALLPAFVLVLGIGEASKIALIVYACSWPILLNTISGVREIDPLLLKSASVLGITGLRLFRTVVLPAALPAIVVGVRLAGAVSVLVLVAAEMIGAKAGLGYLVIYSQYNFQIPQMYFGILSITALGVAFNGALVAFERYVVIWKEPSGERK